MKLSPVGEQLCLKQILFSLLFLSLEINQNIVCKRELFEFSALGNGSMRCSTSCIHPVDENTNIF